jgi:hypothetical protein
MKTVYSTFPEPRIVPPTALVRVMDPDRAPLNTTIDELTVPLAGLATLSNVATGVDPFGVVAYVVIFPSVVEMAAGGRPLQPIVVLCLNRFSRTAWYRWDESSVLTPDIDHTVIACAEAGAGRYILIP